MNLKFGHKVFLISLLNGLAILISMPLIARHYAFQNIEKFIDRIETERFDNLLGELSREYPKSRNWTLVLNGLGHSLDAMEGERGPEGEEGDGPRNGPPPLPPPFHDSWAWGRGKGESPPHPPNHHRIVLFDAEKHPLTMAASDLPAGKNYRMKPIVVENKTVGWLGIKEGEPHGNPLDIEFLKNQSITFYWTAGVAAALATLVAFVLSRHLSAPMRELAQGTRALTSRRFEARIEVRSSDEFGQLAADFNAMAQALEKYERMRRQWIADISHELRTSLAILQGEIEAMQDDVREVSREALDSLHFEVLHVGRIVHDLHDLSLIESWDSGAELTPVNPLKILDETLTSFRPRFENSDMRIEVNETCESEVAIMANRDRLRQLYSNLLENALRYAHAPGVLKISGQITDGNLFLHIEDSGPGVPEESLGRLFDRLYRVDKARSRAHGGSGLGLAICKSIVECFGGRIEASNAISGGLKITMVFPVLSA